MFSASVSSTIVKLSKWFLANIFRKVILKSSNLISSELTIIDLTLSGRNDRSNVMINAL